MYNDRGLLVTTTSSLEGWEVVEYLGPISAQFVIGTGIFADFFSSITDFFGAHSRSYEKKLDLINEEAISLIELKARRLGASAVLGLRVDHDEISGTGKSMLMVTASGTAVRVRREGEREERGLDDTSLVSSSELDLLVRRRLMVERAADDELLIDNEAWRFIVENQVSELSAYVVRQASASLRDPHPDSRENVEARYREFFLAIPPNAAKEALYPLIESQGFLWDFALRTIEAGRLFDGQMVLEQLRSENDLNRRRAIGLLLVKARHYSRSDMDVLREIRDEVANGFPWRPIKSAKGLLGEKTVWECECGNEVKIDREHCNKCGLDRRGFTEQMPGPEEALQAVERMLGALDEAFSRSS